MSTPSSAEGSPTPEQKTEPTSMEEAPTSEQKALPTSEEDSSNPEQKADMTSVEVSSEEAQRFIPPEDKPRFFSGLYRSISNEFLWNFATGVVGAILGFTAFDGMFLDMYTLLKRPEPVSDDVTVLSIGPEALYLWDSKNPAPKTTPRAMLAELISILTDLEATTITLDVLLDSTEKGDAELYAAAKRHGAVIAAEKVMVNQPSTRSLFVAGINPSLRGNAQPVISSSHANLFFTEPILFRDQLIFRGIPLVLPVERSSIDGQWPHTIVGAKEQSLSPALSLASAWLYKARQQDAKASLLTLQRELNEKCDSTGRLRCSTSKISLLPDIQTKLDDIYWLRHTGSEQNDNIRFVAASSLLMLSAERALLKTMNIPEESLPKIEYPAKIREQFKNKAVIIGRVDTDMASPDRHPTAYSFPFFTTADMAGVHIQAQLIERLLTGESIRFFPAWIQWLLGGCTAFLSWKIVVTQPVLRHIPILLCSGLLLFLIGFLLMVSTGWVLELGVPITTGVLSFLSCHIWYTHRHISK